MAKIGELIQSFIMSNPKRASWFLSAMPENFWIKKGQKKALQLFKQASKKVPAYQDFLKTKGIKPEEIKRIEDFKKLPIINKKNYIDLYPLEKLTWDGNLSSSYMIAGSSGATGKFYLWPRSAQVDKNIPRFMELFYTDFFNIQKKKTLAIVCFALGIWAAGEICAESSRAIGRKSNLRLTVVTPGLDLKETLRIVKEIGPKFEQIILIGYATFIRDIIDEGFSEGIDWKKLNTKIWMGGEGINEEWRDYILKKISDEKKNLKLILNLFASAEAGIIGFETPFSILIRKIAQENPKFSETLFDSSSLPSLIQFSPLGFWIEEFNGEIIVTFNSGIPLIRYNIHDRGGIIYFEEMIEKLKANGINIKNLLKEYSINKVWKLPFCFIFGRAHAVTLYAVKIYEDNIKPALEDSKIKDTNTGKFKMKTVTDPTQKQTLVIDVHLAKGIVPNDKLKTKYQNIIVNYLKKLNSEYNRLIEVKKEEVVPKIDLHPFESKIFEIKEAKFKYTNN